jgi:hypothetical protein
LFGYPNYAEGATPSSVVVKTLASTRPGAGLALVRAAHIAAERRGFGHVIHALMHETNLSVRMSRTFGGRAFRRYALWGKRL